VRIVALVLVTAAAVVALRYGLVAWAAVPVLVASYVVGAKYDRKVTLVAVVVVAVGFSVAAPGAWWAGLGPMVLAALVVGAAVGDAVRSRREVAVVRADQARRDERLRIAQDVHDMVAQHIAVVNVQAGVATHLLRSRPDKAEEALEHVTVASAKALDELGVLLGALREPVPSLESLLSQDVSLRTTGTPRPLPATVDGTAYRVIQESLANARKYGIGTPQVWLDYGPERLAIEVRNERSGAAGHGTGYGLVGMRERVTILGGELTAGPEGREFIVRASLPA
jgi:signal transduction histidine kinase